MHSWTISYQTLYDVQWWKRWSDSLLSSSYYIIKLKYSIAGKHPPFSDIKWRYLGKYKYFRIELKYRRCEYTYDEVLNSTFFHCGIFMFNYVQDLNTFSTIVHKLKHCLTPDAAYNKLTRIKSIFSPTRYRPCDCLSTQNLFGHLQGGSLAMCLTCNTHKDNHIRDFSTLISKRRNQTRGGTSANSRHHPTASLCFSCWRWLWQEEELEMGKEIG